MTKEESHEFCDTLFTYCLYYLFNYLIQMGVLHGLNNSWILVSITLQLLVQLRKKMLIDQTGLLICFRRFNKGISITP